MVAAARTDKDFGTLVSNGHWIEVKPDPRQWVWTDDYSNVIGAMIRHWRLVGRATADATDCRVLDRLPIAE